MNTYSNKQINNIQLNNQEKMTLENKNKELYNSLKNKQTII